MAILKTPITQNDHIRGSAHAPITLVEYGDYECPHCALAHPIVNQVQLSFGGRMRFVFRHFPLTEVHPHAEIAAECAEFAGAAGRFWDMHDALFENQNRLSVTTIFLIGEELGLPEAAIRSALETGQYRNKVRSEFMGGIRSGVNGTPAFFINGVRHDSVYDYASLVSGIQMRVAAATST
jgi:protein-disulfide isomerase